MKISIFHVFFFFFEIECEDWLFRGAKKTMILFVIRDHVPQETPLEKLQATLREDMEEIWKGIIKVRANL